MRVCRFVNFEDKSIIVNDQFTGGYVLFQS